MPLFLKPACNSLKSTIILSSILGTMIVLYKTKKQFFAIIAPFVLASLFIMLGQTNYIIMYLKVPYYYWHKLHKRCSKCRKIKTASGTVINSI